MAYTVQFNPQPLGAVTVVTPGTPVRLTINFLTMSPAVTTVATDKVPCNKLFIATNPLTHSSAGNTGKVYIGQSNLSRTTLFGVIAVLSPGGSISITNNVGLNNYDASLMYVDADNASDGVYGSIDTV